MKIALVSEKYTPDPGGLAISAGRLAALLQAAGHTVRVFAPTASLAPAERRTITQDGTRLSRFGVHKRQDDTLVDWFEFLVDEHAREPFDVLHAYFLTQAGFIAAQAGHYLGLPSVVSARGNDVERAVFDPGRAAHVLFALQRASAVTANAAELARKAQALVPGLEVSVIPNGIDADHFRPVERSGQLAERLGISAASLIGFAGELREKKGLGPLLSAFSEIGESRPAVLLIVGAIRPGEDQGAVDSFLAAHPAVRIVVTGSIPQKDLPAYYALMDVFVMPSLRDGLPNALLEAMACGRPVVATRVGGMPDAVTDSRDGRLVPPRDPSALTQAVGALLANPDLARQYGRSARETIVTRFTPRSELEANLAVYRRLGLKV